MSQERRAYARVRCSLLPSDYKIYDDLQNISTFYAQVKDLSPVGVRLVVPKYIPQGHNIELLLTLPTNSSPKYRHFKINVTVIWASKTVKSDRFEMGGQFLNMSEDAKTVILNYQKIVNTFEKETP